MKKKFVKKYFFSDKEPTLWWSPDKSIMSSIYQRGLQLSIRTLQKYPDIKKILDAACGKGRATKEFAKFYKVTACDISEKMLVFVKDLKLPGVKIAQGELEKLPFENNAFDAIVCLETIVHLSDIVVVFSEFYRVLKPGGILILDFDNRYGFLRLLKSALDYFFIKIDKNYKKERYKKARIFKTLSKREVINKLRKAGFYIKKTLFLGILVPFTIKNRVIISRRSFRCVGWLNHFLEKIPLIKNFATYIYLVCQK